MFHNKRHPAEIGAAGIRDYLLENNYDIRTVRELPGHGDVRTTQIYPQGLINKNFVKSPPDAWSVSGLD
ncbi:MAG: hypothetical protein R2747_13365 [Pyrinomonadaceae bacterium]